MKIKQQLSIVAIAVAAWTLCGVAYAADMLHGELLMLVIAAVATLSVVIALVVVAGVAAHWIVQQQAAALAEQRAELVAQRAELAAHSARMQEIGAEIRIGMQQNAHEISDRVLTLEQWTALKARGAARAHIDAALDAERSPERDWRASDADFWNGSSDTGPFPLVSGN